MLTRRQWLSGMAAGSAMLSPLARALAAQAAGAVDPPAPQRFVFVLFENGLREHELQRALAQMPDLPAKYSDVMDSMSRALVKRILADPITYLRSGASNSAARDVAQVFDLDYEDSEDTL